MRIKEKDEFAFRARFCSENEASGDESVAKARAQFARDKIIKKDDQGRTRTTLFFIVFLTKLVSPTSLLQLGRGDFFESL